MAASIENVAVKLRGDANQYNRTLTLATNNTRKFANETTLATVNAGKFTNALGSIRSAALGFGVGFGVTALVSSLQNLIAEGDRLDKLSKQLSASASDLDKLRQVAELSGSDLETAARGLFQLATAIEAAERSPNSRAAQAFKELNITLDDFRKLNPIQQLEGFAKAIARVEDPTKRAEVAARIRGRMASAMMLALA